MIENKCNYVNKEDHTCNYTLICKVKECDLRLSNFVNVFDEVIRQIENGLNLLKELRNG